MEKYLLYINGEFKEGSTGKSFISYNPAEGYEVAEIAEATVEDDKAEIDEERNEFDSGVWSDKSLPWRILRLQIPNTRAGIREA